jgi:multidrug resistance efflux pump
MSPTRLRASLVALAVVTGLLAGSAGREPPPAGPQDKGTRLVRVPVRCDGTVLVIGAELAAGEWVSFDSRYVVDCAYLVVPVADKEEVSADQVIAGEGGTRWRRLREGEVPEPGRFRVHSFKKEFRRLEAGGRVKAGQTVALIDPSRTIADLRCKVLALEAREAERRSAVKLRDEAERRAEGLQRARRVPGSVSRDDFEYLKQIAVLYAELASARQAAVTEARQELRRALAVLDLHECRTPVSGVIRSFEKVAGNPVMALETVVSVEPPRIDQRPAGAGEVQVIRSTRDGVLGLVGAEIKQGETVASELVVTIESGPEVKRYRRLRAGDTVEPGHLIIRLNDRFARCDAAAGEARLRASEAKLRFATRAKDNAESCVKAMEEVTKHVPGTVALDDYSEAKRTARRCADYEAVCRAETAHCQAESEDAKKALAACEMQNSAHGTVHALFKVPGEAVGVGDPILEVLVSKP